MRLAFRFLKSLVELRGGVKIFDFANDTCVKIAEILISLQLTAKVTNGSREAVQECESLFDEA